jgi:hypothetical protein
MNPFVLQEWSADGRFVGCQGCTSSADLALTAYRWMRSMQALGYDVRSFPGGMVAIKEDARVFAILEPQATALDAIRLPAAFTAPAGAPDIFNRVKGVIR